MTTPFRLRSTRILWLTCSLVMLGFTPALTASTLDTIKTRQVLNCGVHSSAPGMAIKDQGRWRGLEADFCRAVASATLGQANRVRFVPFALNKGFTALQSGEIDLLVRHIPIDTALETKSGLLFTGPLFFQRDTFLVNASSNLYSYSDVANHSVCTISGDASKQLQQFANGSNSTLQIIELGSAETVAKAFQQNRCEIIAAESRLLHYMRSILASEMETRALAGAYQLTATGPLVRGADLQWYKTVRTVLAALLSAERLAITAQNADSTDSAWTQLGVAGLHLGLQPDWHRSMIQQVGNFATMYDAHLGGNSPLKMPRGVNALARDGGLHLPYLSD